MNCLHFERDMKLHTWLSAINESGIIAWPWVICFESLTSIKSASPWLSGKLETKKQVYMQVVLIIFALVLYWQWRFEFRSTTNETYKNVSTSETWKYLRMVWYALMQRMTWYRFGVWANNWTRVIFARTKERKVNQTYKSW